MPQFSDPLESFLTEERGRRQEFNAALPHNRPVQYPTHQQPSLPGLGDPERTEQMPLFETHRAGPANVYTRFDTGDANQWTDRPRNVSLTEDEREVLDPGEDEWFEEATPMQSGQFFQFESPPGSSEREWEANLQAHGRSVQEFQRGGRLLGHDAYPQQVNPNLQFEDLHAEPDMGRTSYYTPEGTEVGRVEFHDDEWGPNVDYAEINPLYRGRGFTKPAMIDFASDAEDYGQGIVHAGGFTAAGAGAFHAKGIPERGELDQGFEDFASERIEADVEDMLPEALRGEYPDEDWDSEDAPQGYADSLRDDLTSELHEDQDRMLDLRDEYAGGLRDLQSDVIAQGSRRKGEFLAGWKPKTKVGFQEKLI